MFILMNTTGIFQLKSPENDILETIFVQYTEKKILKIQTPEKFAVIILKFEQGGFTIDYCSQRIQEVY